MRLSKGARGVAVGTAPGRLWNLDKQSTRTGGSGALIRHYYQVVTR